MSGQEQEQEQEQEQKQGQEQEQVSMKLRTDGLYIQFGYRPWSNELNKLGDCWYNIIKVLDDKKAILLGHINIDPFFSIDVSNHKPNKKIYRLGSTRYDIKLDIKPNDITPDNNFKDENSHAMDLEKYFEEEKYKPIFLNVYKPIYNHCDKKIELDYDKCNNFETIKNYYEYLNLNPQFDNFDILNVVKKFKTFDWNSLENKIEIKGIDYIFLKYSSNETDNDDNINNNDNDDDNLMENFICTCDFPYNDPSSFVNYSDDVNSFYIKYSHCWMEGNCGYGSTNHKEFNDKVTCCNQIPFKILNNSFKFTFVPFDLSEKSIWIDEYVKWKERFECHKFYSI
jgi:hypothetical protein